MARKRSLAWLIITICICVIFVPIIVFNTVLSVKAINNPDKLPTIFGISPTAVMTGSMSPEINAKDLIFVQEVDVDTIKENDVICYNKDGEFVTHRVVRIEIVNGVKQYYTQGDANNAEDRGYVVASQIQGKYVGKLAGFGGVIMFLQDPYGLMLTVILLVLLYIAGELIIECVNKRKENKQLTKDNQLLVEENQALKAKLAEYEQMAITSPVALELAPVEQIAIIEQAPIAVEPTVIEEQPVSAEDIETADNEEVVIVENGLSIRYKYKRSFMSRLIQGGESLQGLYTAVKNYLLNHKGVKSRLSWGAETFSYKRNVVAKLCVRGKSLYAYFALTDEEIVNLQIDEMVEASKYAQVPAKIKVTGIIKLNRAKKAVDVIMARLGLTAGEEITEIYSYPYETDEQLLEKGLVKLVKSDFITPEPVEALEQAEALEQVETLEQVEEPEQVAELANEESDENSASVVTDVNIQYKYRRSFTARLIQSGDDTQDIYTTVKNYLLKYIGVKNRSSWSSETFSFKRNPIAKLTIKGKTLNVYLALTEEEIANLQIDEKVENSKFADFPAKIKVTGIIKLNRTTKAIDTICLRYGLTAGEEKTERYSYPYETDEQLIEKGLIKLVESDFKPPVKKEVIIDDTQAEIISDVEDILKGKLTETQKYTRKQYLALPRTKKKKIKTLIRQVDEHLFDEDTPSNARKRQVAEMWREAVTVTNK